jgi:hypothetical protein
MYIRRYSSVWGNHSLLGGLVCCTGHTQKNGAVSKVIKIYFSPYTGTTYTVSGGNCRSFSFGNYNPSVCAPWVTRHVRCNGLQCMRYPITNFMDGRGQWWYINAGCNGVRSGERGGQGRRFLSPFAAARPIQRCGGTRLRSTRTFL